MEDLALAAAMDRRAQLQQEIVGIKNGIADLQARLNRISEQAAEIDAWIEMWHRLAGTAPPPTAAERMGKSEDTQKAKRPKNPDREFVADQALEIIRERGEPVSRKELFDALTDRGVIIQGKDPEMVLSTMLWRSQDRVVRLAPYGYWPKDEEFAKASYYPEFGDLLDAAAKEPEDGIEADDAD